MRGSRGFVRYLFGSGWDVVRILLGLVLLSAACLKSYSLLTEPSVALDQASLRSWLVPATIMEVFIASWLLSGKVPLGSWFAAVSCFGCFVLVAVSDALSGKSSCACWGRVSMNPWVMVAMDGAAIVALLWFPPHMSQRGSTGPTRWSRLKWGAAAILSAIPATLGFLVYQRLVIRPDPILMDPAAFSDDKIRMHIEGRFAWVNHDSRILLTPANAVDVEIPVENPWDVPIRIVDVLPSCACSRAELDSHDIAPRGRTSLKMFVAVGGGSRVRAIDCLLKAESGHQWLHRLKLIHNPPVILDGESEHIAVRDVLMGQTRAINATLLRHRPFQEAFIDPQLEISHSSNLIELKQGRWTGLEPLHNGAIIRQRLPLEITIKASSTPGFPHDNIYIKQPGSEETLAVIPISWQVKSPYETDPPNLFVPVGRSVAHERLVFRVRRIDNQPWKIESVTKRDPWITECRYDDQVAVQHTIELTIDGALLGNWLHTELKVTTRDPEFPQYSMRVSAVHE